MVAKKSEYLDRWNAIERECSPRRPSADGDGDEDAAGNGVFVEKDSYWSRKAGLQAGDIIVGADGWKVDNVEQLDAVLWFEPASEDVQVHSVARRAHHR